MLTTKISKMFLVAVAAVLLWGSCLAGPPADGGEVYYQVTYADGRVRDLNVVPTGREGIRRVVRISRFEDGRRSFEMLATGQVALQVVNPGRTVKRDLVWTGRAWVVRRSTQSQSTTTEPGRDLLGRERARVESVLHELRTRLAAADHEVAEAQRKLARVETNDSQKLPAGTVAAAAERRNILLRAIELYEIQLKALNQSAAPPERGRVLPDGKPVDGGGTLGIGKDIQSARTLPYRVQVWQLPQAQGERTVSVAMAHPEAGDAGAFHYVAYADSDGDGRPDRLLARSALVEAGEPGEWTRWSFTTDESAVYVGNAWPRPDTSVYFAPADGRFARDNRNGLAGDVYVGGYFNGVPCWGSPYGPYLSNIKVNVSNPFGRVTAPTPKIIVR